LSRTIRFLVALLACAYCPVASAVDFLICGELRTVIDGGEDCLLFDPSSPDEPCWLDNYGEFAAGDTVLVMGTRYVLPPMYLCGEIHSTVRVDLIQVCHGFDFGCGTFGFMGDECRYFHSPTYGDFLVDDWSGFEVGDTARVYGGVVDYGSLCEFKGPILADSVRACADTLTVVSPTTWGRLKALFR